MGLKLMGYAPYKNHRGRNYNFGARIEWLKL